MAEKRKGKPYIWVTWIAKLLGGNDCVWSAWFKAHYKYDKHETMGGALVKWNRDHKALMKARVAELVRAGYSVTEEDDNKIKLEGERAEIGGKPDAIARYNPPAGSLASPHTILVDGKTGRQKQADWWQVLIYLLCIVKYKCRDDMVGEVSGEIYYKVGSDGQPEEREVRLKEMEQHAPQIIEMIKRVAGDDEPPRKPSHDECKYCDIGPADCPDRYKSPTPKKTRTDDF